MLNLYTLIVCRNVALIDDGGNPSAVKVNTDNQYRTIKNPAIAGCDIG